MGSRRSKFEAITIAALRTSRGYESSQRLSRQKFKYDKSICEVACMFWDTSTTSMDLIGSNCQSGIHRVVCESWMKMHSQRGSSVLSGIDTGTKIASVPRPYDSDWVSSFPNLLEPTNVDKKTSTGVAF